MPQNDAEESDADETQAHELESQDHSTHTDEEIQQELAEILPEDTETRERVSRLIARHTSGPIPSGSEMHEYALVDPELPRLIFDMAKAEQDHRHGLETSRQTSSFQIYNKTREDKRATAARGQWLGFIVCIVVLGLSALMAVLGQATLAVILAGVDVVGLAAVFVNSSISARASRKELDSSDEDEDEEA